MPDVAAGVVVSEIAPPVSGKIESRWPLKALVKDGRLEYIAYPKGPSSSLRASDQIPVARLEDHPVGLDRPLDLPRPRPAAVAHSHSPLPVHRVGQQPEVRGRPLVVVPARNIDVERLELVAGLGSLS